MADIAKSATAEYRRAFLAFFGIKRCHRAGKRYGMLPDGLRRAIHQMRQKHTRDAKMTEQGDRIVI